jgi:tetratricopeptide (TPR) repeat protein
LTLTTLSKSDHELHSKYAVSLSNATWNLIKKENRTVEETEDMIQMAHTSRYHWGIVGEPANLSKGEWQISRVYCEAEQFDLALHHANLNLSICEKNNNGALDLAYAYEALARSQQGLENIEETRKYKQLALKFSNKIENDEDRNLLLNHIKTIQI